MSVNTVHRTGPRFIQTGNIHSISLPVKLFLRQPLAKGSTFEIVFLATRCRRKGMLYFYCCKNTFKEKPLCFPLQLIIMFCRNELHTWLHAKRQIFHCFILMSAVCACTCMCTRVHMWPFTRVNVDMLMSVLIWRSQDNPMCHSSPSTLFVAGSLFSCCISKAGPCAARSLLSASETVGVQMFMLHVSFCVGLGIKLRYSHLCGKCLWPTDLWGLLLFSPPPPTFLRHEFM